MTDLDPAHRRSTTGRAVVATQLVLLIAYLTGSYGILIIAAVRAGDLGAVVHPFLDRLGDPKDSIPGIGPESLWNPLIWFVGACRLIALLIFPIGFAMLSFGAATLVQAWRRGDRRMSTWLAVLTGIWLALTILATTTHGMHLTGWLAD
ncbi:hypothetical protein Are01nite_41420 [Actinoplanes regularis]|nr:hypothetical protein Are01nite_41420 [Actinoplanes regularis]